MEEKYKKLVEWIILVIAMVIVFWVLIYNFNTKIKYDSREYYATQMEDIVGDHSEKLDNELKQTKAVGVAVAQMLAYEHYDGDSGIKAALKTVFTNTNAYKVIYHGGSDTGLCFDGDEMTDVNLAGSTYYSVIYKAADVRYVYVPASEMDQQDAILFVVPIGESLTRNLLIYYPVERVDILLRINTELGSNSFAAVINVNGNIITNGGYDSQFLAGSNFWENLTSVSEDQITKIKAQIMNQQPAKQAVVTADGAEAKQLIFAPMKLNEWSVVIGVDNDFIAMREKNYWQSSVNMVWKLMIAFLVFLTIYLIINLVNKIRTDEKDRLLQEKADTDQLTGLTNKLATEKKIKEYIAQNPDALAMMFVLDIDNFKKINDTMGHAFGDEVLKTLGHTISSVFRVSDIIGRTGGDEFTIFLKFLKTDENTIKEAKKLVEFFKDFKAGSYVKYSATASIGAAVFPTHGSDFETLYKAADKALYTAKQRGKNQLAFYDDRDRKPLEEKTEENN